MYYSEDEYEKSHSHMAKIDFDKSDFRFAHLDEKFEPRIASIFNQTASRKFGIKIKLKLREVILLDIQYMMDIFCNRNLVDKTTKSKTKM